MSEEKNELEESVNKFNKDSEDIINGVVEILTGKDNVAAIQALYEVNNYLLSTIKNKGARRALVNSMISSLRKNWIKNKKA